MHFQAPTRCFLAALALLPLPTALRAQSAYVFTKIIDDQTARPDGLGDFYIGSPDSFPSLDGATVLFQDITNSANSLWVANASGGGLVKIADFSTAVPGGVGTFTRFDDQTARVQDGVVLFEGLDSNTIDACHGGLYTAPEAGGVISRVFDYNSTAPGSTDTFIQPNADNQITDGPGTGDYDLENGILAFHAITESNADGIYTIALSGTGLTLLANRSDGTAPPFPVNQYYTVALHEQTALFYGATVFGPYGIFSSPATGGLTVPAGIASPYTALPGGQSPEMSTVYFTGFGRFDHTNGNFTFAAHDGSGVNGLYTLPFANLAGGVITKVVDNQTTLPGSSAPASYFDGTPFSADGGQVAFVTADDESAGQSGALYVANEDGSGITRVIGVGDVLDGITLTGIDLGAHALSGGRIAFGAGSYLQGHDGYPRYGAIFVATPYAMSANLAVTLSASASTVTVGQPLTYTVSVVNNGPAAAPSVSLVDTLPAGATFVSATGGASAVNGVVMFSAGTLAAGASTSFQVVANASAAGSLVDSATAASATADPDLSDNAAQNTVVSADAPSVTAVAAGDGTAVSGGEAGKITLRRSGDTSTALTVRYAVGGTARSGIDYKSLDDTATIPAGAAQVKIKIKPIENSTAGGTRIAKVKLKPSSDGSYTLGSPFVAKIKIISGN